MARTTIIELKNTEMLSNKRMELLMENINVVNETLHAIHRVKEMHASDCASHLADVALSGNLHWFSNDYSMDRMQFVCASDRAICNAWADATTNADLIYALTEYHCEKEAYWTYNDNVMELLNDCEKAMIDLFYELLEWINVFDRHRLPIFFVWAGNTRVVINYDGSVWRPSKVQFLERD